VRADILVRGARELRARRSLILAYHGVSTPVPEEDPDNLHVAPERFRGQVDVLLEAGFEFLTVAELAQRAGGRPPPPGLAALSFDDGMEDNHTVLLPILRQYGIPATVYVVTGLIGERNPWMAPSSDARMMTVEELRALADSGIELGAHSVTHPDLSLLDRAACLREMVDSRRELERLTGAQVTTFAYPFCRYGDAAVEAAAEAGFTAAVTCEGRGDWSPYTMKRAMLTGRDGSLSFALKAADAYFPLFESAPGRVVRRATRGARARLRAGRQRRR
jgi:peptidoglycan/xylan/chitin deacetylase (PgdA/CDA1 family)